MSELETGLEYNEQVLAHFLEPHNVGYIPDASGIGEVGDASCGDYFMFFAKIAVEASADAKKGNEGNEGNEERLAGVKYLIKGCGAAIATCSALSDLAIGMPVDEALKLTDDDIAAELGGLPLEKLHCSNYAATALKRAIADYRRRRAEGLADYDLNCLLGGENTAGGEP